MKTDEILKISLLCGMSLLYASCLSFVASIIAAVEVVVFSHGKLQNIKDLPEAFIVVGNSLPLAEETLHFLQQTIKIRPFDWRDGATKVEDFTSELIECLDIVESMDNILREVRVADVLNSGSGNWSFIFESYRRMVLSLPRERRIETLMLDLLVKLRTLILNDIIPESPTMFGHDRKLQDAVKSLSGVSSSLRASPSSKSPTASPIKKLSGLKEIHLKSKRRKVSAQNVSKFHDQTGLSQAAQSGNEELVKAILQKDDINLNHKNADGRTPLSWAAGGGHSVTVKLMADHGADLDLSDNTGRTSLSWALARDSLKSFEFYSNTAVIPILGTLLAGHHYHGPPEKDTSKSFEFCWIMAAMLILGTTLAGHLFGGLRR